MKEYQTHKKCWSGCGKRDCIDCAFTASCTSKLSTQPGTLSPASTPQRTPDDTLYCHARALSDAYSPSVLSLSSFTPRAACTDTFCANRINTLTAKVADLEKDTIRLSAQLRAAEETNEELREVLAKYDRKTSLLLGRTTDCMNRVLTTKNTEISRLEERLESKQQQFAAKLEAESLKTRELEENACIETVKKLQETISKLSSDNIALKTAVKTLTAKLNTTESERDMLLQRRSVGSQRDLALSTLSKQLAEVESLQAKLAKENSELKVNHRRRCEDEKVRTVAVREMCEEIARLKRLATACRDGDVQEAVRSLAGEIAPQQDWLQCARRDLKEIEGQLVAWYSSQGGDCQVS